MSPFVLIRLPCGLHTLIDAADQERVLAHYWNACRAASPWQRLNHYVQGHMAGGSVRLHRWLLDAPPGVLVDHVNGDGLDNRRSVNLRLVSRAENNRNRHTQPAPLSLGWIPRGVPIVEGRAPWGGAVIYRRAAA